MGDFLVVEGLERRFGRVRALDNLSFRVPEKSVAALVGANGAGKTTTFSIIGGFLRAGAGSVLIDGLSLREYRRSGGLIGLFPQDVQFFEDRSVIRHLLLFAQLSGMSKTQAKNEAERVLNLVKLEEKARERVENLSRGMKVRLGMAQALIAEPPLLLLDEPMAGLDPRMLAIFRDNIDAIRGSATIVISSHDLSELQSLCDYVCMLDHGALVRQGSMEEVLRGASQVVYKLGQHDKKIDEAQRMIEQAILGVSFRFDGPGRLLASFDVQALDVHQVNKQVLSWLLQADFPILSVEGEGSLEQIYLEEIDK